MLEIANGLYFHIAETERKCFIEEIPDETTVIGMCGERRFTLLNYHLDEYIKFNLFD